MASQIHIPSDEKIRHKVSLYFDERLVPEVIHVDQYDQSLPIIEADLYADSQHYYVPLKATVRIRMRKPDGTEIYNDALGVRTDRGAVYFNITQQMTAVAGPALAIVEISTSDGIVGSAYLNMMIDKNPVQADIMKSLNDYQSLDDLLTQIKEATARAEAIVNTDKTLSIDGAPADAGAVGKYGVLALNDGGINDQTMSSNNWTLEKLPVNRVYRVFPNISSETRKLLGFKTGMTTAGTLTILKPVFSNLGYVLCLYSCGQKENSKLWYCYLWSNDTYETVVWQEITTGGESAVLGSDVHILANTMTNNNWTLETMPVNRIYRVHGLITDEDRRRLGFTDDMLRTAGTLALLKPVYTGQGYVLCLYAVGRQEKTQLWYSLIWDGDTYETVVWHEVVERHGSLKGKTISIIGDSISTSGNSGSTPNACEIEIAKEDVGVSLKAYLTYTDVQNSLSIGGKTFTSEQIGTEVTFTPASSDVGKKIGLPVNYNGTSLKVWWKYLIDAYGCTVNNVSWSGSGMTSNRADASINYKISQAWHPSQIRKVGIRKPGTMEREAPDYIIICRGINDFTNTPYAVITDGFFDEVKWTVPNSEMVNGNYGWLEAMSMTITKLREAYPSSRIIIATLNNCKRATHDHYPIHNGKSNFTQWVKACRDTADFFGCDLIEFDKDGITFENMYPTYINDSSSTPTHPNAEGHRLMGERAVQDFAKII